MFHGQYGAGAERQRSLNVKHHCYGGDETKMVSVNCVTPVLLSRFIMLVYGWRLMLLFLSCKPVFIPVASCFLLSVSVHLPPFAITFIWLIRLFISPALFKSISLVFLLLTWVHLQRHSLVSLFCIRLKPFWSHFPQFAWLCVSALSLIRTSIVSLFAISSNWVWKKRTS